MDDMREREYGGERWVRKENDGECVSEGGELREG